MIILVIHVPTSPRPGSTVRGGCPSPTGSVHGGVS